MLTVLLAQILIDKVGSPMAFFATAADRKQPFQNNREDPDAPIRCILELTEPSAIEGLQRLDELIEGEEESPVLEILNVLLTDVFKQGMRYQAKLLEEDEETAADYLSVVRDDQLYEKNRTRCLELLKNNPGKTFDERLMYIIFEKLPTCGRPEDDLQVDIYQVLRTFTLRERFTVIIKLGGRLTDDHGPEHEAAFESALHQHEADLANYISDPANEKKVLATLVRVLVKLRDPLRTGHLTKYLE